jgi:hypothetical protein
MRRAWRLAAAVAMILAPASVWAQSARDVRLLTPREQQRLRPEALKAYEAGVKSLDKINPVQAITQIDQAAQLAPESLELQFLAARLAHLRARRVLDADADKFYEIATKALERVAQKQNITPLEQHRCEVQMQEIKDERQKLELRKQKRLAVGVEFRKAYAKERYIDPEMRERAKEQERREKRGTTRQAPGAPLTSPGMSAPPAPMPGGGALPQPPGGGRVGGYNS